MKVFEKQFICLAYTPEGSYRKLFPIRKAFGFKSISLFYIKLKKNRVKLQTEQGPWVREEKRDRKPSWGLGLLRGEGGEDGGQAKSVSISTFISNLGNEYEILPFLNSGYIP